MLKKTYCFVFLYSIFFWLLGADW